jgi:hypothetical protein
MQQSYWVSNKDGRIVSDEEADLAWMEALDLEMKSPEAILQAYRDSIDQEDVPLSEEDYDCYLKSVEKY